MKTNPEVDKWFKNYDNPKKDVVNAVRMAILESDTKIVEVVKWSAPTFIYKGNLASFFPKSKQHASLMFHKGADIPGKFPSFEGDGKEGRVMKFIDLKDVSSKKKELAAIVKAWIKMQDSA